MNPIRSLAPCIVNRSFPEYLWIYFVGPIAGIVLAVLVYKLVVTLEYEIAKDQDPMPELILPIAGNGRKPSSIIPMASAGPPTPENQVQEPAKTHKKSVSFGNRQPSGDVGNPVLHESHTD
jgi:aquaporin related protein